MKLTIILAAAATALLGSATGASAQNVNFDELTSPPVTCCYANTGVHGPLTYAGVTIHDANNSGFVMNGEGWAGLQTSGANLFGTQSGSISFDFSNPVSNLAFDLINGTSASTYTVQLFGLGNSLLDSRVLTLGSFGNSAAVGHVSFADSGIASARITGSNNFAVDTISFGVSAVPEPSTWALMLLGFGGMGLAMRRDRRRSSSMLAQVA
ncbi:MULTISPECIES: PEPxxWA-CTERM sorting domain-containing protein [Sphingomonas]|uniref:PEPxxWA-CTERM sorting domain-containing protein n=1 Tax=Sphingomonas TaxID=13687 RepID=UPI000DEEDF3F|nr:MULTISPECIES: PEPxxWA-CTERM sorting domain-containing protein [Sphingomonas]